MTRPPEVIALCKMGQRIRFRVEEVKRCEGKESRERLKVEKKKKISAMTSLQLSFGSQRH